MKSVLIIVFPLSSSKVVPNLPQQELTIHDAGTAFLCRGSGLAIALSFIIVSQCCRKGLYASIEVWLKEERDP